MHVISVLTLCKGRPDTHHKVPHLGDLNPLGHSAGLPNLIVCFVSCNIFFMLEYVTFDQVPVLEFLSFLIFFVAAFFDFFTLTFLLGLLDLGQ